MCAEYEKSKEGGHKKDSRADEKVEISQSASSSKKKQNSDDSVPSCSCTTFPIPLCVESDRMERSGGMDSTSESGSEVHLNYRSVEAPDTDD